MDASIICWNFVAYSGGTLTEKESKFKEKSWLYSYVLARNVLWY
jgi:hypothetical protein